VTDFDPTKFVDIAGIFATFGNDPRIVIRISVPRPQSQAGVSWRPLVSHLVVSDPVA
jgi:hypothetical protein